MRKYILAALVAGTFATPALAQETAGTLGGFRLEGLVGYESADVEDGNSDGLAYGVGVGFDAQSGNMVFGIEAEAMKSEIDECVTNVNVATDQLCVDAGRDLYVGGRVGAVVGANSLVYAKAGYTNAKFDADYRATPTGTVVSTSENLDGVRVGGGVQVGLGTNLYAKAEYRYSNYEQGFDKHQGVVGLGFKF
jgi:outer membrane immunogenic protein